MKGLLGRCFSIVFSDWVFGALWERERESEKERVSVCVSESASE